MAIDPNAPQGMAYVVAMIDRAFDRADADKNGKLNHDEFKAFNEFLKPGIAVKDGKPTVDYNERMDKDGDGNVTNDEVHETGFLIPASMTMSQVDAIMDGYFASQEQLAGAQATEATAWSKPGS